MIFGRKKNKNKKEKEEEKKEDSMYDDTQHKNVNKARYKISIWEKLGNTPREVKEFIAVRFVDEDDNIPYLKYEDKKSGQKFLEVFPQQVQDFMHEDKKTIERKLDKARKKLNEEKSKDEKTLNLRDVEYEIMKLEAKLRTFKYSQNSSYMGLDKNNMPVFFFLREGSSYHPFKWDLDTSTIYTPSDNKKKSATVALRNKENKYPQTTRLQKFLTYLFLIILMVGALGFGYLTYKATNSYSDSEINKIKEMCLKNVADVSTSVKDQAKSISNIAKDLEKQINKPQTVVQGKQTRDLENDG